MRDGTKWMLESHRDFAEWVPVWMVQALGHGPAVVVNIIHVHLNESNAAASRRVLRMFPPTTSCSVTVCFPYSMYPPPLSLSVNSIHLSNSKHVRLGRNVPLYIAP